MAKAKLTLTPNPTFKATVMVPVAGGKPVPVEWTFKYRDREEYKEFFATLGNDTPDADLLLDIGSGWDLDDPYDRASMEKFARVYMAGPGEVLATYVRELSGAREKN